MIRRKNYCFCLLALFFALLLSGCGVGEGFFEKPVQETSSKEDSNEQLTPTPIIDDLGKVTIEALLESLDSSVKEYGTAGFYMNLKFSEESLETQDGTDAEEPDGMLMQMDGNLAVNPTAAYMTCKVSSKAGGETVSEQVIENYTLLQDDGSVTGYLYDAVSDSWLSYEETGFEDLSEQVSLIDCSAISNRQIFDSVELVVTEKSYEIRGTIAFATFCGFIDMGVDINTISESIPGFEELKVYVNYLFDKDNRQIESFQAVIDKTGFTMTDEPVSLEMSMAVDFEIVPDGAHIEIPENLLK